MGNGEDRMKTFVSIQGIRSTAGLTAKTAVMAVACFAVTLAGGCKKKEQAPPPPPPSVEVTQVVAKDTPIVFEYVAQTQSSHQVNIQARVNGFLEKRTYTEGAVVKTGDVLFVMDKKPYPGTGGGGCRGARKAKGRHGNGPLEPGAHQAFDRQERPVAEGPG